MAKARKPKITQSGSWFTITDSDGNEHKVQGEDARDAKLAELGYSDEVSEEAKEEAETVEETVEEDYEEPAEPGTVDDRPTSDDEIEQAKAEAAEDAIPPGVRARQPGAESAEEQRNDGDRPEPESVRLAREDDERAEELKDLDPAEAHFRQARRSNEAGAARTRRPVVPGPQSDTVLPQTGAAKEVADGESVLATGATDEYSTAIDARGYQTSNDGRGPFTAEALAESPAADAERERRERKQRLQAMSPEERQEALLKEAEEAEESKPEVARKPALRAALDTTVEPNITLGSGVPTGPATHPASVIRNAPDGTEPGNTLRGYAAPQKVPAIFGAKDGGSEEE